MQPLIDFVMHKARPARSGVTAARLRRVLFEQLAEVRGAVAARVQARKELDVRLERQAVFGRRVLGEARHHGVEELPGGAAQFGSVGERRVSEGRNDGMEG